MATIYTADRILGLKELRTRNPITFSEQEVVQQARVETTPFSKGASRWAFEGEILHGDKWEAYVMKRFIKHGDDRCNHTLTKYLEQNEQSIIASYLADQYNSHRKE